MRMMTTGATILGLTLSLTTMGPAQAETVNPGWSKVWQSTTTSQDAFTRTSFRINTLPSSGSLWVGPRVRAAHRDGATAQAAIGSDGRIRLQITDVWGNRLKDVPLSARIRSGQVLKMETEVLGNNRALIRVRAWVAGNRPQWQATRYNVATRRTTGTFLPRAYTSRSSRATNVDLVESWSAKSPYVGSRDMPYGKTTSKRNGWFFVTGGQCRLDFGAWKDCPGKDSSFGVKNLPDGWHHLQTRSTVDYSKVYTHKWKVEAGSTKPQPKPQPKPKPKPKPQPKPQPKPRPGGQPGWNNTGRPNSGLPAPQVINPAGGVLKIRGSQTLDNKIINGRVEIESGNVVIKNSIIRAGLSAATYQGKPAANGIVRLRPAVQATLKIEDTTIEGDSSVNGRDSRTAYVIGLRGHNITANRVHIRKVSDGVNVDGSNFKVTNSFIHEAVNSPDSRKSDKIAHTDGVQVAAGANIELSNNTINGFKFAAVMVTPDAGNITNIRIRNNWLDGGSCTVNMSARNKRGSIRGVQVIGNRFGSEQRSTTGNNWHCGKATRLHGVLTEVSNRPDVRGNKTPSGQVAQLEDNRRGRLG